MGDEPVIKTHGDNTTIAVVGLDNVTGTGVQTNGTGNKLNNVTAGNGNGTIINSIGDYN